MYFDKLSDLGIKLTRRHGSEKTFCPKCHDGRKNKRDRSLSVNVTTGEYKCHNTGCDFRGNVRSFERRRENKTYLKPPQDVLKSIEIKEKAEAWFSKRGISRNTLDKFMIFCREEWMPQTQKKESCICFPYFRDGEIINVKYRDGRKNFKMVKDAELILYNLQSIGEKKYCVITEGEIDALSVYEVGFGKEPIVDENSGEILNDYFSQWCVVSVPNGASMGNQKLDYLDGCAEWLVGIETFVIATDGDQAGEELKQELIRRLGVERCKTISYPMEECVPLENNLKRRCKDLNEVLIFLGKEVVINVINNAESIPVDGIYYVDDIFHLMLQNFQNGIQLAPKTYFGELDDYFRWKKGEINLFVGWANHGKTTLVLQLMLTKSVNDGWKWAIFSPENYPATDFYDDLIEMYAGKWLERMSEEDYIQAALFIDQHIFYVYPDDGHDIHSINEKFRYLVLKKGIDGVLIDPFNQLDRITTQFQREDLYLSDILKDIKRFALLNSISYNIVAHPAKQNKQDDKSLPPVDMYDIAGGAMWANKADNIISYYRPNHHIDKTSPEVKVFIQKIKRRRTGGKPGEFEMKMLWSIKRFVDPISELPYLDPQRNNIHKQKLKEQNLWLPYADNDLTPDEENPPF
jgi:twinkle protein